ncbi:hypothetical protein BDK51DRAFT_31327 [Blyttiomyces helicus]|uniref:GATA-type domain-containing protein n=1 Tax=Blyttiomyces helicus TaxID=388810 RepID=A0A4P9W7C5_9FUNG|nr:hypothetical protein BDK51DRAFT_31327 [Blyttiomyces helicus]|eukprot:RKO86918.1 hypothetical protein BDK51DRAFT_31327 [Blyttiomyces helicus]
MAKNALKSSHSAAPSFLQFRGLALSSAVAALAADIPRVYAPLPRRAYYSPDVLGAASALLSFSASAIYPALNSSYGHRYVTPPSDAPTIDDDAMVVDAAPQMGWMRTAGFQQLLAAERAVSEREIYDEDAAGRERERMELLVGRARKVARDRAANAPIVSPPVGPSILKKPVKKSKKAKRSKSKPKPGKTVTFDLYYMKRTAGRFLPIALEEAINAPGPNVSNQADRPIATPGANFRTAAATRADPATPLQAPIAPICNPRKRGAASLDVEGGADLEVAGASSPTPATRRSKRVKAADGRICADCGLTQTPMWRHGRDQADLCNKRLSA